MLYLFKVILVVRLTCVVTPSWGTIWPLASTAAPRLGLRRFVFKSVGLVFQFNQNANQVVGIDNCAAKATIIP